MSLPLLAAARRAEVFAVRHPALRAAAKRLVIATVAFHAASAAACPMCKDAAPADAAPAAEAAVDFNPSIGVMLAATAGVAAVIGRAMFKAARSADADA